MARQRWLARAAVHAEGGLKPSARPPVLDALPWGARTGTVAVADADLGDMPYLKGDA